MGDTIMTIELGSARWTSNSPLPFSRAPGAGGMRGLHESGFAAETLYPESEWDPKHVFGQDNFVVKKEPVAAGMIPAIVVRMRYTDRGVLTQANLDKNVYEFLKSNGFMVSLATSFKPVQVTWKWAHETGVDDRFDCKGMTARECEFLKQQTMPERYFPVVATPTALAGLRYYGSATPEAMTAPDAKLLSKLPREIYVYTMAATTPAPGGGTMTDAEAARVLTLVKQAKVNMASAKGYASTLFTLRGCPPEVFCTGGVCNPVPPVPPVIVAGFSSLLLIVAYNMIASHVGSERL